jgi:hypothetical protein
MVKNWVPVAAPSHRVVEIPAKVTAARSWGDLFREVLACKPGWGVLLEIEESEIASMRENVRRYAYRCSVKISSYVVDGKLYVARKPQRADRRPIQGIGVDE